METTEKVVESYCRYVRGWFTIPNLRCKGQYEVDLLAIAADEHGDVRRWHIECGVSISGSFSKLTAKPFSKSELKKRVAGPSQRRTIGYFLERKFNVNEVLETLARHGFEPGNYRRVIVTWDATKDAIEAAKTEGVEIWYFPNLLLEIASAHARHSGYLIDDTARTVQLYAIAEKWKRKNG